MVRKKVYNYVHFLQQQLKLSEKIVAIQTFKYRLVDWETQNKEITCKRTAQSAEPL